MRRSYLIWLLVISFPCFFVARPGYAQPSADAVAGDSDGQISDEAEYRSAVRRSIFSKGRRQAGLTTDEQSYVKENCVFGSPKAETSAGLGQIDIVAREGYVVGHSSFDKIPLWVAEHSTAAEVGGSIPRNNRFAPDPKLASHPRAELSDYKHSGFDRGHMAPAGNQTVTQALKDETFFLSNMVPQIGPTFNQGIWAELETTVREWTKSRSETWIITGGMFYDPLEEDENTADGIIPYDAIGQNEVAVPTHTYKIVLAKNSNNEWESIAFVFANKRYAKPYRLHLYITSIRWLEQRTGLNFFPNIVSETGDAALEDRLELTRSQMWSN
ncbi:Nuclease precursor [Lignipirellula cremea]|uniref:Endonuclease n=2 Tax=Lignipirellula cremea TaxID=2528010 RepID=A0A518DQJ8_9BACT|nr:Nuclease precursor [Lignipirellula cremea]